MAAKKDPLQILIRSRRFGLMLCIVGFIWGVAVINLTILGHSREPDKPEELREEILKLSEDYVRTLSKETQHTIDGPFAGRHTGYDLKKTIAVLLESMLDRLDNLEKQVDEFTNNNSSRHLYPAAPLNDLPLRLSTESKRINAKELILGAQEDCSLTTDEINDYPHCRGKMEWMNNFWKSDKCYSDNGVDGTLCSFRYYLSEIESWCPQLPGRMHERKRSELQPTNHTQLAEWNFELDDLINKLHDPGERKNYEWIRLRIKRLWNLWVDAAKRLSTKQDFNGRQQKRILVHLGLLSVKSGFRIPESAQKGGPLGELVQWSDIISALYILGHDLKITSEVEELSAILDQLPSAEAQCQIRSKLPLDMIYTDIVGLTQFKKKVRHGYGKFSCLLRIIDSFGTEASFNNEEYAKSHQMKTQWGMQNLNLQQFYTMFPHSPDNSFMGFIVEQHLNSSETRRSVKKDQAVVYGKAQHMWTGKESYLSVIKKHVDIHATVFVEQGGDSVLPKFVTNHGILSGPELHKLLQESKLFIGLGFPYEGPAPLEAIAQGCVFINPKFDPPHNSQNTKFFRGKPTLRKVTSQHPYAEDFIAEPYVYTVDIDNLEEVEKVIKKALHSVDSQQAEPYLPYEYTHEGMLQRLNAYIKHQDFCSPHPEIWPPLSSINVTVSSVGKSCKTTCWEGKQICEPSHFKRINSRPVLEQLLKSECTSVEDKADIYFPGFETASKKCYLQKDSGLFSCVGEVADFVRVCPCRDFIRGQTALCKECL